MSRRKKIILFLLAVWLVLVGLFVYYKISEFKAKKFNVTFFNIGQGDAALIKFNNGKKMLVDCGPSAIILSRLGQALPFYDRTIDYLLISHPDLDHYGGCVDVLKRYEVKEIITNGEQKASDLYWQAFFGALKKENATEKIIFNHQVMAIGSSTLEFLAPDIGLNLDSKFNMGNNKSIVFKLTKDKEKSFLFTGDMETPLEDALVERYCSKNKTENKSETSKPHYAACLLHSDILKVGHHGSNSSSGENFLLTVKPQQAIVSVGKNKFGHPSLRVIRHLERLNTKIIRTDISGDVIIKNN